MREPELVSDNTLAGLRVLTAQLTHTLVEAEALRVRVMRARAANVWPELRTLSVFRNPPSDHNQRKPATEARSVQAG